MVKFRTQCCIWKYEMSVATHLSLSIVSICFSLSQQVLIQFSYPCSLHYKNNNYNNNKTSEKGNYLLVLLSSKNCLLSFNFRSQFFISFCIYHRICMKFICDSSISEQNLRRTIRIEGNKTLLPYKCVWQISDQVCVCVQAIRTIN